MGLKLLSEQFRKEVLSLNLKTPPDIVMGLTTLTNAATYTTYIQQQGKDPSISSDKASAMVKDAGNVVIIGKQLLDKILKKNLQQYDDSVYSDGRGLQVGLSDYNVTDTGTIDKFASDERRKLFARNKPLNLNEQAENHPLYVDPSFGNYSYSTFLNHIGGTTSIGKVTKIGDATVPNSLSLSTDSTLTPETSLNLTLQSNRYIPDEIETYKIETVKLLQDEKAGEYYQARLGGMYYLSQSGNYTPSQFLNLRTSTSPISVLAGFNTDPIAYLLDHGEPALKNESLLMNIAALELKFNLESRIRQNLEKETVGRTKFDEAFTNPLTALNLLTGKESWFERNNSITVADNVIGKSAEFLAGLAGLQSPISLIRDIRVDYMPKCFDNAEYKKEPQSRFGKIWNDLTGKSTRDDRDVHFLNHTGVGQKYSLFSTIKMNKYSPDYLADYESGVFNKSEEIFQDLRDITRSLGIGAGGRPMGRFYFGDKKSSKPVDLLQDSDGDQVGSNELLTQAISTKVGGGYYEEAGYSTSTNSKGVSDYGSIETNFIWSNEYGADPSLDVKTNRISYLDPKLGAVQSSLSHDKSKRDLFRECSILDKTQQLINKGLPFDQTLTKFYDRYTFNSRGSAVISPVKLPNLNSQGEVIGYRYVVPGLDVSGRRNDEKMYNEAEMCRVWTKTKPYTKVKNLPKFSELIRKERNSVIDRYGNLNIFPSKLNTKTGSWSGEGDIRKYMLSIENLAWRDSKSLEKLPDAEKGSNGGRIMWFPPYDIKINEDTSANWDTHLFLGRPEPIYTYNNSERRANLSFKVIVDHPSILKVLVQKELNKLTDGEVDEILNAFWAGCIDFDVFELARIWDQFSQDDIDYFKRLLSGIDTTRTNEDVQKGSITDPAMISSQKSTVDKTTNETIELDLDNNFLYFENDVPSTCNGLKITPQSGSVYCDENKNILPYSIYYNQYINTLETNQGTNNYTYYRYGNKGIPIRYDTSIGKNSFHPYILSKFTTQFKYIVETLNKITYDFDYKISFKAFTSPLASDNYNRELAQRRYVSVGKWLLLSVLQDTNNKCTINGLTITNDNIHGIFDTGTEITIERSDGTNKHTIDFVLDSNIPLTTEQKIKDVYGTPLEVVLDGVAYKYFLVMQPPHDQSTPPVVDGTQTYYFGVENDVVRDVFRKASNLQKFKDPTNQATYIANLTSGTQVGALEPTVGRKLDDADYVCSVLSDVASLGRKVSLSITGTQKPQTETEKNENKASDVAVADKIRPTNPNITKREIAQKILNRLIKEGDYFEILEKETPFVYNSLKEKLKYFTPAFHSMTPEGLNSRLTFLHQCLRPGEILTDNRSTCVASNTAFGKPPVCVLRVGDFYHTKCIITQLNINYDPLVWDLNPEGIGMQPMVADVSLTLTLIGGSGLRKPVNQLQNALSFNYYANADVYDERTFANTDDEERALINQERSFFDGGLLDIAAIVNSVEQIKPSNFLNDTPSGTIGNITKKLDSVVAGGEYGNDITKASWFDAQKNYDAYSVVEENYKFYRRTLAFPQKDPVLNPNVDMGINNPIYWEEIEWKNYGEECFRNERKDEYFSRYEIEYSDIFTKMYESYGNIVQLNHEINQPVNDGGEFLLQLLCNKNYNKPIRVTTLESANITTGSTGSVFWDEFEDLPVVNDDLSNLKVHELKEVFDNEANERNYVSIYDFLEDTPLPNKIKLHLNPQEALYKIGNGKTTISSTGLFDDNTRYNPDDFGGKTSIVGGFYVKDYRSHVSNINYIIPLLAAELKNKINLDLQHFWHYDSESQKIYQDYAKNFSNAQKRILKDFFIKKLDKYYDSFISSILNKIEITNNETHDLINSLIGISVITDGYDLSSNEKFYEVIPNESINTRIESLFGFDPYNEYVITTEPTPIPFIDVNNIISQATTIEDLIPLCNGIYFFRQISTKIATLFHRADITQYTSDNYLPQSIVFEDNVDISENEPNFKVVDGIVLNSQLTPKLEAGETTTLDIGLFTENYKMKYNFEKINYELFYFSNVTQEVMLNDNYITRDFDFDVTYDNSLTLSKQINNLRLSLPPDDLPPYEITEPETINIVTSGSDPFMETFGFTYLDIMKFTPTNYYQYLENSVLGTNNELYITKLNEWLTYSAQLKFRDQAFDFSLSGFVDLIFNEILGSLTEEDKTELLTIAKIIPKQTPQKVVKQTQKNIERVINNLWAWLPKFYGYGNEMIKNIHKNYSENAINVNIANNLTITQNPTDSELTPQVMKKYLMRGDKSDYTLTLKEVLDVKGSVKFNYGWHKNGLFKNKNI